LDAKILHTRHVGHALNTIAFTPEPYQFYSDDGFSSLITCGGDYISSYTPILPTTTATTTTSTTPITGTTNALTQNFVMCDTLKDNSNSPIWKIRYTSSGSMCYSSDDSGIIRQYKRFNNQLHYLGIVYQHKGDVQDIDISPYDECKSFFKREKLEECFFN
jgi:hypothetical protein